jgi:hypothetical protein
MFTTITSNSVWSDDPKHALRVIGDLTSDLHFHSKVRTGQWICCDFHELRVRQTHYMIRSYRKYLKSWVVESSLDGETWTEIDRKTDNNDFIDSETASFAVLNSPECRFIRLTQTGENHAESYSLSLRAFELFGTVFE